MTPKPKAVVWDVDDVLTPTSIAFYNTAIKTHGQCSHPDLWEAYNWGSHIGLEEGCDLQRYLIERKVIEACEAYDYTKAALDLTCSHRLTNILLSARSWHPDPHLVTKDWAVRSRIDTQLHAMFFCPPEISKRGYLETLTEDYDIVAFVDDNGEHAVSAIGLIPQVILIRRGWNRNYQSGPRLVKADTALEAAQYIVNLL